MAITDRKTLIVAGKQVAVEGNKIAANVYEFTATIDGHLVRLRQTIGDDKGRITGLSAASLQRMVDEARKQAAEIAAGRTRLAELEAEVE
jgi:hypothetical protein